jgi:hypothetical protein
MDTGLKDELPPTKVTGITFLVFEGDIERDERGRITNKLREVITHSDGNEIPHEEIVRRTIEGGV